MLKYIICMFMFGLICHAKHVDVFENDDSAKTIEKVLTKRQDIPQIKPDVDKNSKKVDTNLPEAHNGLPSDTDDDKTPEQSHPVSVESNKNTKHKENEPLKFNATLTNASATLDKTVNPFITIPVHINRTHSKGDHNGALLRGFYVFLGLSVLVVIYLTFRAFRVRPGAPPPSTVRKYGIVGRRSDMEMLPLPLNEEEDDDTLFDVGHQQIR